MTIMCTGKEVPIKVVYECKWEGKVADKLVVGQYEVTE